MLAHASTPLHAHTNACARTHTCTHARSHTGRLLPSSDVYAMGVLMWEVYTGEKVFTELSDSEVILAVVTKKLRPTFPLDTPSKCVGCMPGPEGCLGRRVAGWGERHQARQHPPRSSWRC